MTARIQVRVFAAEMERKLRANDFKGGWQDDEPEALLRRLEEEVRELRDAIEMKDSPSKILAESADVANFAMMIADVCDGLRAGNGLAAGSSEESGGTP